MEEGGQIRQNFAEMICEKSIVGLILFISAKKDAVHDTMPQMVLLGPNITK